MDINNIVNSVISTADKNLPSGVNLFHKERNSKLVMISSFEELAHSFPFKEEFIDESKTIRVALALNILFKGVILAIVRTTDIFLGKKDDVVVNLDIIDAIIASRPYLPGGEYGILGKIDALRNNSSLYYDKKIRIIMDDNNYAYEFNKETGEKCYMAKGTLEIFDNKLAEIIINDPKIKVLSPKI